MYVHVNICMFMSTYINVHVLTYVNVHVLTYVNVYALTFVNVYVLTYGPQDKICTFSRVLEMQISRDLISKFGC